MISYCCCCRPSVLGDIPDLQLPEGWEMRAQLQSSKHNSDFDFEADLYSSCVVTARQRGAWWALRLSQPVNVTSVYIEGASSRCHLLEGSMIVVFVFRERSGVPGASWHRLLGAGQTRRLRQQSTLFLLAHAHRQRAAHLRLHHDR